MSDTSPPLAVCLCAAWCGTCESYRPLMQEVAALAPRDAGWRFGWLDVEDEADALVARGAEAPDIETFPTLLVMHGGAVRFLGPLLPQAAVLERLLAQAGALPAVLDAGSQALGLAVARMAREGRLQAP